MELRYVYRLIEDDIGTNRLVERSPHSEIARRIRIDYRESRDFSERTKSLALCLASISGNGSIDIKKTSESVNSMLLEAFSQKLPYIQINTHPESASDKELDELKQMWDEMMASEQEDTK